MYICWHESVGGGIINNFNLTIQQGKLDIFCLVVCVLHQSNFKQCGEKFMVPILFQPY